MNRDQWTRFLYIEIESIGLNFFSALHVSCRSHSKNFQNVSQSSLSFPPTLSLSLSLSLTLILTLTLIPSCSITLIPSRSISHFHSLSLRRCPLLSVSFPLLPSRFVVVALSLHHSIAVAPSRSIASSPPHSAFLPQTLILVGSTSSLSQK